MKLSVILVPVAVLALAGCSSQSASKTPTQTVAQVPKKSPTAVLTVAPQPTATAVKPFKPHHIPPPKGSPLQKGQAYLQAGQYKLAEFWCRRSLATDHRLTQRISAYGCLGTAAIGLGDYLTASRAYKTCSDLDPRLPICAYRAGYAALYSKDYHASVKYTTRYIALEPKRADGYHLRFLAYGQLLLHAKQVKDGKKESELAPKDANAWTDYGIGLGNDSQYGRSIAAFTRAIQLRPTDISLYTNRAIVENLNGQQRLALADLEKARSLARDPGTIKSLDAAIKRLKKQIH